MIALGQPPDEPGRAREWLRHVAVIAAYRDQHKVTTDDPRQVLGPYAEPGHAGYRAYWHAAESVLAARRLAGLEPANGTPTDSQASAQLAADIYRNLPDDQRAAVAELVATAPGSIWLGDPAFPDEHAAAQPAYTRQLVRILSDRGYLSDDAGADPGRQPARGSEPLEAELARRGRSRHGISGHQEKRSGGEPGPQVHGMPRVLPQITLPTTRPTIVR